MRIKMPDLKFQDTFSGGRKPEMSRLNDPGMNRPDWNFEYPFPFDFIKEILPFCAGNIFQIKIFA